MAKSHRPSKLQPVELAVVRRLRATRTGGLFSLNEFAREIGIKRSTLANYEYGVTPLPFALGMDICDRLNISPRWLATGAEPQHPFVSRDEIGVAEPLAARGTFLETYRATLAEHYDQWFAEHTDDDLVARTQRDRPEALFRRMSPRELQGLLREWVSRLREEESPHLRLAVIGNLELALAEARAREEEKIAGRRKKNVDETTSLGHMTPVQIADRLKQERKALGFTQEQAAIEWGVPVSTLRNWEQGARRPRGLALRQLETILRTAGKPSD